MKSSKVLKIVIAVSSILLALLIGLLFITGTTPTHGKTAHGLKIAETDVGDISLNEAALIIDQMYSEVLDALIPLTLGGITQETTARKLGLEYDTVGTVEKLYMISNAPNLIRVVENLIRGSMGEIRVEPVFVINEKQMKEEIKKIFPDISESRDAEIEIDENMKITVKPEKIGFMVNFTDIYFQIESAARELKKPEIRIVAMETWPTYTQDAATGDAAILEALLTNQLLLKTADNAPYPKEIQLSIRPEWVSVRDAILTIHSKKILAFAENELAELMNVKNENAEIEKLPDTLNMWATVKGMPKDGQEIDTKKAVKLIMENIHASGNFVTIPTSVTKGKIINHTDTDLGTLALLGEGRSNFAGSPNDRGFNIRKGVKENMNNIIVAPGEIFSFNSYLGDVSKENGWLDALTIFPDQELRPSPGGGLCQVSTTFYRAILASGLKIVEKSNHSLYVHYYKAYGDGLDATIFPGSKDLRFKNDTPSYLFVQSFTEDNDVYVRIYGTPDGRKVTLTGPRRIFFDVESQQDEKNPISQKIIWTQTIQRPDGKTEENTLVSTYRTKS